MDLNDDNGGGAGGDAGSVTDFLGGAAAADAGDAGAGGVDAQGGAEGAETGAGGDVPADFLALFPADTEEGDSASLQDWVKSVGAKDAASLAKIARDNQRALRESGRIKVPGEGATDQEIAAYREAIGVPAKPEDYARPEINGADGKPVPLNAAMTDRVFAAAHKLGLPKSAAEALVAGEVEAQLAEYDAQITALQQAADKHVQGWGEERDAKLAQVNAALKDLGFSREDVQYMRALPSGPGKFLDAMAKIGTNFSEDALVKGEARTFGMKPEDAQKEIDTMRGDRDMAAKMVVPGTPEYQRYHRLLDQAARAG